MKNRSVTSIRAVVAVHTQKATEKVEHQNFPFTEWPNDIYFNVKGIYPLIRLDQTFLTHDKPK